MASWYLGNCLIDRGLKQIIIRSCFGMMPICQEKYEGVLFEKQNDIKQKLAVDVK